VLWLSASPSLGGFNRPLLRQLARQVTVRKWQYQQTADEASSVMSAVHSLTDYLNTQEQPVHLVGHGISGVVALTYARCYPERVRSLTLLAVAARPAMTWQAHYYVQRQLLPCSRYRVLAQMAQSLFGPMPYETTKHLVQALDRDLVLAPSLHSLFKLPDLPQGGVAMPLLICHSKTDSVVDPPAASAWLACCKPYDHLWECPAGRHFFHYFYPELVSTTLLTFWDSLTSPAPILLTA
jgi:pimeloyl-ACP methyl ester carboxylesterase